MSQPYASVVMLGAARSGTKFLREVLSAPHEFVAVPFDANHLWRIGNARAPDDVLKPESLSHAGRKRIREALWRVARKGVGSEQGQVLLEKTVSNALRPEFVEAVLPDSRYLLLFRDGRDAVESTYRMWHALADGPVLKHKLTSLPLSAIPYALWYAGNLVVGKLKGRGVNIWGVRYKGIMGDLRTLSLPEVCAKQWVMSVQSMLEAEQTILAGRCLRVYYERLITESGVINEITDFLELPDRDTEDLRRVLRNKLNAPRVSRWRETFSKNERTRVEAIIKPQQSVLGYI